MHTEFWLERWESGETGWHLPDAHPMLVAFWESLDVPAPAPVFVPLCGKTPDLAWLAARGHRVIGCELSRLAVESWFAEQAIEPDIAAVDGLVRYRGPGVELWCGDFFALQPRHLAGVAALYDRAALIALPAEQRVRYVGHLARLFPRPLPALVITLDYPQQQMDGPPFAVSAEELAGHFARTHSIETLADIDALAESPRFRERGVTMMRERAVRMRPMESIG
ncbi:MAG: thiopurine S-methyltransferase [Methylotetracoccus sp.]